VGDPEASPHGAGADGGVRGDSAGPRSLAIRWHDPQALLSRVSQLSGLQYVQALRDGSVPAEAFASALGVRVVSVRQGEVTLAAAVQDWHVNVGVVAHGGFLSTLMDIASGLAVHSTLEPGRACPHAQASYRFLRPARPGAALSCTAQVIHQGRTLAAARAEIRDSDGHLIALGDATHAYVNFR
jgi:uncharacterized protein (TIGR00369 family)